MVPYTICCLATALICLASVSTIRADIVYTVIDVGGLQSYDQGVGYGVNSSGQVAGARGTDAPGAQPFLSAVNGGPPLTYFPAGDGGQAVAVNDLGQATGYVSTVGGTQAFLSAPNGGTLHYLGFLPGGNYSDGTAVNASGEVTGESVVSTTYVHAFLSAPNGGALKDLGTLPGGTYSIGLGVNSAGQVAGYSTVSGHNHAFLSAPNGGALTDLGTLGGTDSEAYAVNDSGQVAGFSTTSSGAKHAFLSAPNGGALTDLGTLPGYSQSEAFSVNASGQVVGKVKDTNNDLRAFIYSNGQMVDLNSLIDPHSGYTLIEAFTITDNGLICGGAIDSAGVLQPVLLVPTAVPEPSSIILTGFAVAAFMLRRRPLFFDRCQPSRTPTTPPAAPV